MERLNLTNNFESNLVNILEKYIGKANLVNIFNLYTKMLRRQKLWNCRNFFKRDLENFHYNMDRNILI